MEELLITSYLCFWLTILGAVLGSFFDCAVSRWARGGAPFRGRSRCDACGHVLGVRDLIPILSFALCRGKCRYCGAKIPWDCLAAELAGGAAFCLLGACYGPTLETAQWLLWAALLLVMALIDQAKRIIPNWILLALAANRALWLLILRPPLPQTLREIGLALLVPLALLALVLLWEKVRGKEMMGGGDIKLLFVLGLYLSWGELLLCLLAGCLLGLAAALLSKNREGMGNRVMAFGPFLAAGALLTVCFGGPVIGWYLGLF